MIKKIHGEKIKNILRSFEPEISQNLKNTGAEIQISWSYKKKRVLDHLKRCYITFFVIRHKPLWEPEADFPVDTWLERGTLFVGQHFYDFPPKVRLGDRKAFEQRPDRLEAHLINAINWILLVCLFVYFLSRARDL